MKNQSSFNADRRSFLKSAGHLLVGFQLFPTFTGIAGSDESCGTAPVTNGQLIDAWIRFDADGKLTVITGKMELGQGIRTALMQMAAEELDIPMNRVRIIIADTGQTQDERYTAGSGSIEGSGRAIRNAAAEARQYLLKLAAQKLETQIESLSVENGVVISSGNQKKVTYQELVAGKRLEIEVTGKAPLKDPATYKLIGKGVHREDIAQMAVAKAYYIQDMRLPEMVHARVLRPPVYNAKLISVPREQIEKLPDVLKLVVNGNFVSVIAAKEYTAVKALEVLKTNAKWDSLPLSVSPDKLYDHIQASASASKIIEESGSGMPAKDFKHEATYKRPYQMHGSIGPSCAIALWKNDLLTVWSHTQGVYPLRKTISDLLKMPENKIRVIGVPGAGCYGHNGADDAGGDAALLAMEMPGRPVRVQWMREDEHKWEPYGSAMVLNVKGRIGEAGKVDAWNTEIWSDTHSTRPGGNAGHLLAGRHIAKPFVFKSGGFSGGSHRNSVPLYDFASRKISLSDFDGPLRTSALRSLGAYANIFALESFMDELAWKAGEDPVAFRLSHLKDERARKVITTLVEKAGWGSSRGEGFAFAQYKNSAAYLAVKAEVSVDKATKSYQLTKLTAVIDSGQVINRDGIINQTSGGMIQAASWTMLEEVKFDETGVRSTTWETYPILRFDQVPHTEVYIIDRPEEEPLGAGEAAQGPTSAAIANAICSATGSRLRELPLTSDKIDWAKVS
ncbi:xanthine dehydrogenase family protein molybdopterin-binding subunit [Dyadobacter aurulentus]|uniref:xanthine dehydrogenase family protein molybdopterin-binding subunit n=1 Tax=Dyadobacter sp. UC 10 TaxID=2605428 RepID=UPI0011F163DC|nr:molybdopterin cofactor-binding domain-containing protein [Dyadobacter sp. UC 10]KAA0990104.1 xanthine dehydrogenase family protein molybdopterin-binding subunit [Dyadobacter sp. UC 10]